MFNLFIDRSKDPRSSAVLSIDNTNPNPINAFVIGDTINLAVHLLDGAEYAAEAGTGQIKVSLGQPGDTVYCYQDSFTVSASAYVGNLNTATSELYSALSGVDYIQAYLEVEYTYPSLTERQTLCQQPIYLYNTVLSGSYAQTILPQYLTVSESDARYVRQSDAPSASFWIQSGNYLYAANDTWSFGLGTHTPSEKFHTTGNGLFDGIVRSNTYFTGSFIGRLTGTSSQAVSSSYAVTSSRANYAAVANQATYAIAAGSSSFSTDSLFADVAEAALYATAALSASYSTTSSLAVNATSASYALRAQSLVASSYPISTSYASSSTFSNFSSLGLSGSFASSSLTASYALRSQTGFFASQSFWAVSASFASSSLTASFAQRSQTGIFASQSFWAVSASYASSSTNLGLTTYNISVLSASQSFWAASASWASSSFTSVSSSYLIGSHVGNTIGTASWAEKAQSAIFASQSFWAVSASWASSSFSSISSSYLTGSVVGNVLGTSSWANKAQSAIFASQSFWAVSSSYASSSTSSSYAFDSSKLNNQFSNYYLDVSSTHQSKSGNLTIGTNTLGLFSINGLTGNHPFIQQYVLDAENGYQRHHTSNRYYWDGATNQWAASANLNDDFYSIDYLGVPGLSFKFGNLDSGSRNLTTSSYNSYEVVRINSSGIRLLSGSFSGSITGSLFGTSSYADNSTISITSLFASQSFWAVSASWASSSFTSVTSSYLTGSVVGNMLGTASWANKAQSSIFASQSFWSVSASYASSSTNLGLTAYNISVTSASQSFWAVSASWASSSFSSVTSSYLTGSVVGNMLGTASWANKAQSSIFASQSFWSVSASYASSSTNLGLTAYNISVTSASQSFWAVSASWASSSFSSISSSYLTGSVVGNVIGTASWANKAQSSIFGSQSFWGVSSSYASSSTNLGLSAYNISVLLASQSFWAVSASWASSSFTSVSSSHLIGSHIGNTLGTASWAEKAQSSIFASQSFWAVSASYASSSTISSNANLATSASYASLSLTASYANLSQTGLFASQSFWAVSASYVSSSTISSFSTLSTSASFASSSVTASFAQRSQAGFFASQSFWAVSASFASSSLTASFALRSQTGIFASQSFWSVSASYASSSTNAISANYASTADSANTAISASWSPPVTLDELRDVIITSPVVNDVLGWNGSDWVNQQVGNTSAGSSVLYYLDGTPTFGGNDTLSPTPSAYGAEVDSAQVSGSDIAFIDRYLSPVIVGNIDAGIWKFHTYASVDSSVGNTYIYTRINRAVELTGSVSITGSGLLRSASFSGVAPLSYSDSGSTGNILSATLIQTPSQSFWIRSVNTPSSSLVQATTASYVNETSVSASLYYLLFRVQTEEINSTTPFLYETTTIQPEFSMSLNDRIVAAYFATTTSPTTRTINLYHGGTSSYSYIETPLITRHNDLRGLQGGSSGEYYHLTLSEYTGTGTGIFVRASGSRITATGSLLGTSSYADRGTVSVTSLYASQSQWAISSSFASSSLTASYAQRSQTGIFASQSFWAVSSSYASSSTLSIYSNFGTSASFASSSLTASYAHRSQTGIFASQSFWAVSASWASSSFTSVSASYLTGSHVGNTIGTASWANKAQSTIFASQSFWAVSASYASSSTNLGRTAYSISVLFASQSVWAVSASWASSSFSSSYSLSSSYAFSSSYALSASYARTASYISGGINSSVETASYSYFAELARTSSYSLIAELSRTSSWSDKSQSSLFSSQSVYSVSASWASSSFSSSYSLSASYAPVNLGTPRLVIGDKVVSLTTSSYSNVLTVNMPESGSAWVRISLHGFWPSAGTATSIADFVLAKDGVITYNQPGAILSVHNFNTNRWQMRPKIVDPGASAGSADFNIEYILDGNTNADFRALYELRGVFNTVS